MTADAAGQPDTATIIATLLAERDAALAREAALAEVLAIINRSPGDLAPVFDAILERALHLSGAVFGILSTYDGELFHVQASRNIPPALQEFSSHGVPPTPGTMLHRMVMGESVAHLADIRDDDAYRSGEPTRVAIADRGGARTQLLVAMRRDSTPLGAITVFRTEVRPFTPAQIALLEAFAAQAVIAMENARLLTEQHEALEQQTATAEVLGIINANPGNLAPVFDALLERAMRLCGAAFGNLATYDGTAFNHVAARGVPAVFAEFLRAPMRIDAEPPGSGLHRMVNGEDVVHDADLTDHEFYRSGIGTRRPLTDLAGACSRLMVALRKDGALLGVFNIFRQEVRPFSDKQVALLQNFAVQAVIAMENARLITEQREALEQQTATTEVLQVINASPGCLAPVFGAMLEKALRLCDSAFGIFATYDGEFFHNVAARGVPADPEKSLERPQIPIAGLALFRIAQGEDVVQIADITDDEAYRQGIPGRRYIADVCGGRTQLLVALRKDGAMLGVFNIFRQEVRPFTDKQIALLEAFAAQAVIAMENARLLTEQREALERQTATAEVLAVINANAGNLSPVFDAILEKSLRLSEAAFGMLTLFDGEAFHLAAARNLPSTLIDFSRQGVRPEPGTLSHRLVMGESAAYLADIRDDEAYRAGAPSRVAMADLGGARSQLLVALRKDNVLLGALNIFRTEVRPFTPAQITLVESFAAQAVIAMENARLLTEQREALEQQTATAEVMQVINSSPGDLTPVFDVMLQKAMRLCGAAFGSLYTYDGERFHTAALRGVPETFAEFRRKYPPQANPGTPLARMLATRQSIHTLDLMTERGYLAGDAKGRSLVELGGARTALAVPMLKDDTVVGFITIYRQEVRAFSNKETALLENFAAQAVIAMENARLLHELRMRTDEVAQRQAELRITFENMGDGVALYDETQHLVAWNRKFQEIFSVPDSLLEQHGTFEEHVRYLARRGDYGPEIDPDEMVFRLTEHVFEYHAYERTRPDGRVIEIRHNPVPDGGFVLIFSDITERKRSEAEIRAARDAAEAAYRELKATQANLIQAEKMASLGQLTAGIAHEIKNPLNFVNNFSTLSIELLDELKHAAAPVLAAVGDDRRAELDEVIGMLTSNLAKIAEHGRRADGIVRSMLEHSRGGSGERRSVDLNTLVEEALNLAYHGARAQDPSFNITLERDFGVDIAPVTLVPQDITRVLLNLCGNGFYAARKRQGVEGTGFEPAVRVTTRDLGDAVEIRMRDNGIGIPAEIRDRLFQPFFTTKPTGEGTGLGLSISYDIVTQQHGGSMIVDSQVGEYSEFTVQLPRLP